MIHGCEEKTKVQTSVEQIEFHFLCVHLRKLCLVSANKLHLVISSHFCILLFYLEIAIRKMALFQQGFFSQLQNRCERFVFLQIKIYFDMKPFCEREIWKNLDISKCYSRFSLSTFNSNLPGYLYLWSMERS